MKTLHVHIGTHKTATTSIQVFCYENEKALEQQGYCYPEMPFQYSGISEARNGHFLIGKIMDRGEESFREEEQIFREGMQIINECFQKFDHVVLSDEGIWLSMDYNRRDLWERIKKEAEEKGFAVHVIVYLKRQDKYLQSVWNQRIKAKRRIRETFEEFMETIQLPLWLDYYQKLERMAAVIGKENITVRRFEPACFAGGNIYEDFLQALGLSLTEEYKVSSSIRNQGLYGNVIEIKRILNDLPAIQDEKTQNFMKDRLVECSGLSAENYPCAVLSKEETADFLDKYRPGNRKIAKEYLCEADRELFDETIEDLPKWEKNNPYMLDDVIRFVGAMGMELYEEQKKIKEELRKTEKQYYIYHPFKAVRKLINGRIRKF